MTTRKIASHFLLTPNGILSNAIVSLSSKGIITNIESQERLDSVAGLEFYSGILLPCLVNSHCHLELSYLKGQITPQCGFAGFAKQLSECRDKFSSDTVQRAMDFWDAKMWAEGIGLVGDVCNSRSSLNLKSRSRIDYFDFAEVYGLNSGVDAVLPLLEAHKDFKLECNLSPHSCYSLNTKTFRDIIARCDRAKPISVHFMETQSERELFEQKGELWHWYSERGFSVDFLGDISPVDRIIKNIPPEQKILLVHNTVLAKKDAERLISHFGDNLSWVLCPKSNKYISGQTPDIKMLMNLGARILIGTDSLSSNTELSLCEELKCFADDISLLDLIAMVTTNATSAFSREDLNLKVGNKAQLVLLKGADLANNKLLSGSTFERIL